MGPLLVGHRLHVGDLLVDAGDGRGPHRQHQGHGLLRRLDHLVAQLPVGERGVAQEPGALVTQLQDFADDRGVVVDVLVVAAAVVVAPDLLPQRAVVGIGQERIH